MLKPKYFFSWKATTESAGMSFSKVGPDVVNLEENLDALETLSRGSLAWLAQYLVWISLNDLFNEHNRLSNHLLLMEND